MKKLVAVISIALVAMLSIMASPLPFDLDLDYDLDYLIDNDFELERDEYGTITISPPDWHWSTRDLIVEEFSMVDTSDWGDWFIAMASFEDYASYEDIYYYIADEVEEDGYDADTTIEFINLFYTEPTEEELADLLLSDQLAEYLCDAIPAQMIIQIIENSGAELQYINMWLYDDVTIYTFMANGVGMAIYVNNDEVYDIIETELGLAFLEAMI